MSDPGGLPLSKISIVLPTRNRPEFLERTLRHFQNLAELRQVAIQVIDGSDEAHWPKVERACSGHALPGLTIHHSPPEEPFQLRICRALERCKTPYLMFAADDDFYLPGWLSEAVAALDAEADLGTVYGHVLFFSLPSYVAYGPLESYFIHPRAVPPLSWLEHAKPSDRIRALNDGTHESSVPGWYALQRTSLLKQIIGREIEIALPMDYFEYWFVFHQTLLGKTRMLDRIILARQEDRNMLRRSPTVRDSAQWLALMRSEFVQLLQAYEPLSRGAAEQVVDRYLRGAASELKRDGDRAWTLRIRAHPVTRFFARYLLRRPPLARDTKSMHYPDTRLPPIPAIGADHPAVRLVRKATTQP